MYSKAGSLVLGFHGCDESVRDLVIIGKENLRKSHNDYDWLGHGFYFWENNPERANNWAIQLSQRPKSKIKKPAVLGAIIDLGYCLDFLNNRNIMLLNEAYKNLSEIHNKLNLPIPINKAYVIVLI